MPSKIQERIYVEWFLQHRHPWSPCPVEDCEEPDFLMRTHAGTRGVEIVNIQTDDAPGSTLQGSKSRQREAITRGFLRRLARLYYERSDVPIHVGIVFFGKYRPNAESAGRILDHLLAARDLAPWEDTEATVCLNDCISCRLYLDRLPDTFANYSRWECVSDHVGFVSVLKSQHIQQAIDKKARRLPEYRKKCDAITLLVVADRMRNSGKLGIQSELPQIKSRGFDEVWVLMYPLEARKIV